MRCLYVDLDGTLLGAGARCCATPRAAFSLLGVRALEACDRADIEVVIYSGRRQLHLLLRRPRSWASASYIFEAGAGVVLDGELHWLTGDLVPRDGRTIFDQIEATGAPRLLLDRYAGRLEYHAPWHQGREVSHLFRGDVDAFEADALLEPSGHGDLRLVDNGGDPSRSAGDRGHRARLPPRSAQRLEGRRGRLAHARPRLRARGLHRDRRLARGPRRGRGGRHVLARRQRRSSGTRRSARR